MSNLLEKIDELLIEEMKKLKRKVDINMVPEYSQVINNFETEDFKKLAIAGLEAAPLQFWIMPAAMSKRVHHSSEHGIGEIEYDNENHLYIVKKIGGKAFHTLRVLDIAEIIMEADDPVVSRDFHGNIKKMVYGNEMTPREKDLIRTACLWHDIYSGGTEDEFDINRRYMDKNHPHYHRKELAPLSSMISIQEWDLLLKCIEQHMWKWDDKIDIMKFHDLKLKESVQEAYKFANEYRIVRIVELSDLIASRNIRS